MSQETLLTSAEDPKNKSALLDKYKEEKKKKKKKRENLLIQKILTIQ